MVIRREPRGPLRLFVQMLWYSDDTADRDGRFERERVLPTGSMHVVVRLTDPPLRVFDGAGIATDVGRAVIGGARSTFYERDISRPSRSVGALLCPGGALPLLGIPAETFAERHTALEDVWGSAALELRDRLLEVGSPHAALDLFESALAARFPRVRGVNPVVAHALARFETTFDVGAVVDETGYSHRHFITMFHEAVGLTPKRYCRVRRFQRVLSRAASTRPWSEIALDAGYSDQAHFTREFRELAGVSPSRFRLLSPAHAHHVPIDTPSSNSFKTVRARRGKIGP
ncbi:helix-turn-helix domain-containing protein [Polyangium jinanense]|uniref:helix-turn-helix domain-containing protein n=1 Tax=Polyangium jinanense TaxID=2829994 RepID=UPI0023405BCD|nr:AraC family transcriptional regulator [Polyangium jinanense]